MPVICELETEISRFLVFHKKKYNSQAVGRMVGTDPNNISFIGGIWLASDRGDAGDAQLFK